MSTNATTSVGWVPEPSGRGTIGLVWSCLSTLFICVWTSLHLNCPRRGKGRFYYAFRKTKWMLLTTIVPEFAASVAVNDWVLARRTARECREAGLANWTSAHAFLINMSGIRLVNNSCPRLGSKGACPREMFLYEAVTELHRKGLLPREVAELTAEDIADRSKADGLVKTIAGVQTLWFIVQCVGRAAQGLHLTALEIATPGFVLCALVNYAMWYHKPLDVSRGVVGCYVCTRPDGPHAQMPRGDANDGLHLGYHAREPTGLITVLLFVAFGAVHCAAWNADFPTPIEAQLWRIAAVLTTGLPLLFFMGLPFRLEQVPVDGWPRWMLKWLDVVLVIGGGLYAAARVYLVVEMFASLRVQPPDCYQSVEWAKFFPHIG